ncbi:MAG: acyltransferase [Candidatus Nanoarchaeia archaeon]|jgi:acetyltransferase-like isoleucine patch superfamily enzyme
MKKSNMILGIIIPRIIKNIYLMIKFKCFVHPFSSIQGIRNLKIGKGTQINKCSIIAQGKIIIGENCIIDQDVILNSKTGFIKIGNNTSINPQSIIHGNGGVTIGNHTAIAPGVKILKNHLIPNLNNSYSIISEKSTIIGDYVWICANVVIIDGVSIGNNVIIGANSFVNKDIKKNSVVAGCPTRLLYVRTK